MVFNSLVIIKQMKSTMMGNNRLQWYFYDPVHQNDGR